MLMIMKVITMMVMKVTLTIIVMVIVSVDSGCDDNQIFVTEAIMITMMVRVVQN